MTTYHLATELRLASTRAEHDTDEEFEVFVGLVEDELVNLAQTEAAIAGPEATAVPAERTMKVSMGVEADCLTDAVRLFGTRVRTAIRITGKGGTFKATTEIFPVRAVTPAEA